MSEKASKQQAHYRSGAPDRRCSLCTMFRAPDICTAVKGDIRPSGVCDYFKRSHRTIAQQ